MEDRNAYKQSLKHYNDLKNAIDSSERGGVNKGIGIGIEKGIKQVGKKMKDAGMPIEQITELTGLTAEEIDQL
ncbi:MAG: hypothetical protein AAFV95_25930 [Bacteroidota bacterium]